MEDVNVDQWAAATSSPKVILSADVGRYLFLASTFSSVTQEKLRSEFDGPAAKRTFVAPGSMRRCFLLAAFPDLSMQRWRIMAFSFPAT